MFQLKKNNILFIYFVATSNKVKFKKAKKSKKYFVRVRSYYIGEKDKVYSQWSKTAKVK